MMKNTYSVLSVTTLVVTESLKLESREWAHGASKADFKQANLVV